MQQANTLVLPAENTPSWLRSLAVVLLSSFLIGLFAKVAIPLPFTPVPIATQGLVILLLSFFLGSKKALASVVAFLAQGVFGLPVFATGVGGVATLIGPTGGYLFSYLVAAFLVGYLAKRMVCRTPLKILGILVLGNAMFFLFGVPYLASFIGFKQSLLLGFAPFIFGDLLKLIVGVKVIERLSLSIHK